MTVEVHKSYKNQIVVVIHIFFDEDKEFGEEQYYQMRTRSNVPYKFKNLTDVGVDQPTLAQMSPHQSASELIPDNANEVSQCPSQRQLPYNRMPKR